MSSQVRDQSRIKNGVCKAVDTIHSEVEYSPPCFVQINIHHKMKGKEPQGKEISVAVSSQRVDMTLSLAAILTVTSNRRSLRHI